MLKKTSEAPYTTKVNYPVGPRNATSHSGLTTVLCVATLCAPKIRAAPSCAVVGAWWGRVEAEGEGPGLGFPQMWVCIPRNVFCSIWRYFYVSEQSQVSVRIEEAFQIHAKNDRYRPHKKTKYRPGIVMYRACLERVQIGVQVFTCIVKYR